MTTANTPKESGRWTRRMLVGTVMFSRRHAWSITALATVAALASLIFIISNFKIDTSVSRLLFRRGDFTHVNKELVHDFPSLGRRIIVEVHSDDASTTAQATRDIVQILKLHPHSYPFVYAPTSEPLFRRDGLLYLSTPRLRQVLTRLTKAEPLLGSLQAHPNVRGYAHLLGEIIRNLRELPTQERHMVASIIDKATFAMNRKERSSPGARTPLDFESTLLGSSSRFAQAHTRTSVVIVSLPRTDNTSDRMHEAVSRLKSLLHNDAQLLRTRAHWAYTGSVILSLDQLRAVTSGTDLATLLSIVLSIVILIVGLRSIRLLLPILICLLIGLIVTAAFALMALGPLNLITVAFGVLFIGLGVDFSIQFCIRLQEELSKQANAEMAFSATAYRIGFALFLAALAAASCFYAVIPSGYSGIRDLGIIAGTGALIALVLNLTLLPALLTVFRAGRITIARPPVPFAKLPVKKLARPIFLFSLVMLAISVVVIPRLEFDFDLAHLENHNTSAYRVLHQLERKLSFSPYTLEAVAPNLARANRWAVTLRHLTSVGRVLTLSSYIPEHQKTKMAMISNAALLYPPPFASSPRASLARDPQRDCRVLRSLGREAHQQSRTAPLSMREVLVRFANATNSAFGSRCALPALESLNRHAVRPLLELSREVARLLNPVPITIRSLPATIREDYLASNGKARVEIFSRLDLHKSRNLQKFVSQVTRVIPDVGGTPVLFVRGGKIVTSAFREASLLAFLFIIIVVSVVLRSLRDLSLTIVPLALSVSLTLTTLSLLGIQFNIANIIVIPLSIGLSVAFGIYMILRWKNNHYDIRQVLRSSVPEGILVSGMTTLLVFGTLVLTPSPGLFSLGITLVVALFWTLVSSLIILPSMLYLVEASIHHRGTQT